MACGLNPKLFRNNPIPSSRRWGAIPDASEFTHIDRIANSPWAGHAHICEAGGLLCVSDGGTGVSVGCHEKLTFCTNDRQWYGALEPWLLAQRQDI
jgi:hypothetical protein